MHEQKLDLAECAPPFDAERGSSNAKKGEGQAIRPRALIHSPTAGREEIHWPRVFPSL